MRVGKAAVTNHSPLLAVGGIRVSSDQQADMYGPDRQRQEIEEEAQRTGLQVIEWIEESVSGANHDRAAENRYYQLARQRAGLNFIFSHPNRVGRHVEVIVGIARQLHQLGATVHIAGLGNLRDRRNWKHFLRDAADAEADYQNIVFQLVSGKRAKAAIHGKWPHGDAPYGYLLQRDHRGRSTLPAPDPVTAPVVRRIFELAETLGQGQIQQRLNNEGIPTAKGGPWMRSSIKNILTNRRYTGEAIFQGLRVHYEPLVTEEQFERVQQRRAARRHESGPRDRSLLWAGHVRCACCGNAVGRDSHKTKYATYVYYRCWRSRAAQARRDQVEPCPNTHNWAVEQADTEWWAWTVAQISSPDLLERIVAQPAPPPAGPPPARVAELEAAIARAWEPFAAGKVPQAVAERLAAPYMAELAQLQAEYAPQPAAPRPAYAVLAAQLGHALAVTEDPADRRELLQRLDIRLYVGPDGPERLSLSIP